MTPVTATEVEQMRALYKEGWTQSKIANEFHKRGFCTDNFKTLQQMHVSIYIRDGVSTKPKRKYRTKRAVLAEAGIPVDFITQVAASTVLTTTQKSKVITALLT